MSKEELETMLLGELPDLSETRSGKDLIAIGEKRGEKNAMIEAIATVVTSRFGEQPAEFLERLEAITMIAELKQLHARSITVPRLEDLFPDN